jgi:hypothetical protein
MMEKHSKNQLLQNAHTKVSREINAALSIWHDQRLHNNLITRQFRPAHTELILLGSHTAYHLQRMWGEQLEMV